MTTRIDFPIFTLPGKYVSASNTAGTLYTSVLHKSSVNQTLVVHKGGERDAAVNSGLLDLLAADIEANYKSLAYPTALPMVLYNAGVANGIVEFVGTSSGTAGEQVVIAAATASTAVITIAVSAHTATITFSDTASINTANALVTAWNANTAATAEAKISLYLGTMADGTSRNSGAGLVASNIANQQLLQANTYQLYGKVRMAGCVLGIGHQG